MSNSNLAALNQVNFEKEFNAENALRKRIGRGDRYRKKGGGSLCHLPSDNITRRQWESLNGEIKEWNLKSIMSWEQFTMMKDDMQAVYLNNLLIYGGNNNTIADMFNLVGTPDKLVDVCVTAEMIKQARRRLRVGIPPEREKYANEAEANKNFSDFILTEIDKLPVKDDKEEETRDAQREEASLIVKNTKLQLTEDMIAKAKPEQFFAALIKYLSDNKNRVVRDYDKVQKDTLFILNKIKRLPKRDNNLMLDQYYLIIHRNRFLDYYLGKQNSHKFHLFILEMIKNGIAMGYVPDSAGYIMSYYVNDKYPADHKNNRVQVIPLPINEIPEPYRKSIYDILCDRYSERTMNRLFHYGIVEKETEEEEMKNNKDSNPNPIPHPQQDKIKTEEKSAIQQSVADFIKSSQLANLKSLDLHIHGSAVLKGSKMEILQQAEKYIDTLGLTELKIEF